MSKAVIIGIGGEHITDEQRRTYNNLVEEKIGLESQIAEANSDINSSRNQLSLLDDRVVAIGQENDETIASVQSTIDNLFADQSKKEELKAQNVVVTGSKDQTFKFLVIAGLLYYGWKKWHK